ncbi:MAG: alpha/beta hydrolase family protein [Wenzhouxiangella sp.]
MITTFSIFRVGSRQLFVLGVLIFVAGCSGDIGSERQVGRLHLFFEDPDRQSWSSDGSRPVQATVWYPAAPGTPVEQWRAGVFLFGSSALNAPFLDGEQRPLVVISHGTGGSAAQMSWLAERLATAGFLVAGVNHHGNTATEERQWPAGFVQPWERSRDLSLLIDRLLEHAEIGARIDDRRIGAAGFSLGGYSVLGLADIGLPSFDSWIKRCKKTPKSPACQLPPEANFKLEDVESMRRENLSFQAGMARGEGSFHDDRISAVYAVAPALISLLQENDISGINRPTRFVLSKHDEQIGFSETKAVIDRTIPNSSLLVIERAGHYVFLAPCTLRGRFFVRALCVDPIGVNRRRIHTKVGEDAVAFFDLNLNDGQF